MKENIEIEYDGRMCTSRCGNDIDCPHLEIHADILADNFHLFSWEKKMAVLEWFKKEDFADLLSEFRAEAKEEWLKEIGLGFRDVCTDEDGEYVLNEGDEDVKCVRLPELLTA